MSLFIPIHPAEHQMPKKDPDDLRLGQLVQAVEQLDFAAGQWTIAGYCDDEGVRLNQGRLGANEGPDRIRHFLYRMTPHLTKRQKLNLQDIGNLNLEGKSLAERHQAAAETVQKALAAGGRWLGLGGGHDYAYSEGAGFLRAMKNKNPLIVNFDAHLDVRPFREGLNSGTPFRRLITEFKDFDFLEIGIQDHCNTAAHRDWLKEQGGLILYESEIHSHPVSPQNAIREFLEPHLQAGRPTFLSVDMDAFSSAFAPGCSQSWPTGLQPQDVLPVMEWICEKADVMTVGIYETAPPLDLNNQTSRLAAVIAHRFLHSNFGLRAGQ